MRFIEVGINKFEVEGESISCVRDGVVLQSIDLSSEFVSVRADVNTTVMFRDAGTLVAISPVEWDYLCGRIDSLLVPAEIVSDEAPVEDVVAETASETVAEEATPVVATTRRGRRTV
jgi:hypothetical protein